MLMRLHGLHRSIPPSERIEKTRSGYVIPPQAGEAHRREREGGRFPAQYSLHSHFSMDTMYGIWSGFFRGAHIKVDVAVSSIFSAVILPRKAFFLFFVLDTVHSAALLHHLRLLIFTDIR